METLQAGLIDAVLRLGAGVALEYQLVDQSLAGECGVVEVVLRGLGCLDVPVGRNVNDCERGVIGRVVLELELFDQSLA